MVDVVDIMKEESAEGGRFVYQSGEDVAQLLWKSVAPDVIVAVSTQVPESMRGMRVGEALVNALIADALTEGYRIIPKCPYVRARGPRHPDWDQVAAPLPDDMA